MRIKLLAGLVFVCMSSGAFADDQKHGCGWGSMMFDGKSGLPAYILASTTNATAGNGTFGMTSDTNGCQTHHPIQYGGQSWFAAAEFSDEIVEDIAKGEGEALDALALMIGIEQVDRAYFNQLTHDNFEAIVPSSELTGEQVMRAIEVLLASDERLSRYVVS
jgi:Protein of unknown function (DUF3015)